MSAVTRPPLLVIAGATASGKSALAMALAERMPVELISADSAQVYRGMDIGTAKPSAAERRRIRICRVTDVEQVMRHAAARFAADARAAIDDARARGRLPVLVGGTLLYLRALLSGLSRLPSSSPALRQTLLAEHDRIGPTAMHARLATLDPVSAERLHPNDWQRVQRALEIVMLTDRPASEAYRDPLQVPDLGPLCRVAVVVEDRQALHQRIEARFHQMMADGLLVEVEALFRRGDLHDALSSVRSVGYRQLWAAMAGSVSLATAVEQGIAATRQLAKRQLTWLRNEPGWQPVQGDLARQLDVVMHTLKQAGRCPD